MKIGLGDFAFKKDTYIQVQGNLMKKNVAELTRKYSDKGMATLIDSLTDSEYSDLLYCIYKSQFVPRGIRRALEPIIERLEKAKASQG